MVLPNPFSAFDKEGAPCGICPRDPDGDGGAPGRFVGARVDRDNTEKLQKFKNPQHEIRSEMQRTRYEYLGIPNIDPELAQKLATKEPIRLPVTKYYKDRLREGSLLAADQATATEARLPRFVEPTSFFARFANAPEPQPVQAVTNDAPSVASSPESDAETNTKTRGKRSEG